MNDKAKRQNVEQLRFPNHQSDYEDRYSRLNEDDMPLEKKDIYREAGNTIRHFSNATRTVRTLSIAQASLLTYAISRLVNVEQYNIAIAGCGLGIIVTIVLFYLHRNYHENMIETLSFASSFEKEHMNARHHGAAMLSGGPWSRAHALWIRHEQELPELPVQGKNAMKNQFEKIKFTLLKHRCFLVNYAVYYALASGYAIYIWMLLPESA